VVVGVGVKVGACMVGVWLKCSVD